MKRPLILLSILTYFSVTHVFAQDNDKKNQESDIPSAFEFDTLNADIRDIVLSSLPTRDRINLGATCKELNGNVKELNNRVFMIDGSRKQFIELTPEDFQGIKRFNDFYYIGKTYLNTSDPLRLWTIDKCINGSIEINSRAKANSEESEIKDKFYQNILALKPLEIDENLSVQERLGHLASNLTIEILSEIGGKEISAEEKSIHIDDFYHNILELDLTESIDAGTTSNDRLVHHLINQQLWAQVGAQVWAQVRAQVGAQVEAQAWAQVWAQVGAQVRDQVEDQVWAQVEDQVWDQVGAQVGDQVWDQVGAQVKAQVWAPVGVCLSKYDFKSAFDDGKLSDVLKPAINSAIIAYQFASISSQNSPNFRELREGVSKIISESMTPGQIDAALNGIDIPDNCELPVANTFLEILRKSKAG